METPQTSKNTQVQLDTKPIIVALDFANAETTLSFLQSFSEYKPSVKVGMELFYQEGPKLIHDLKEQGYFVFLDLKLHDIPNTVKQAMKGLARLGADLVNVHAAGGSYMMEAAIEGLEAGTPVGSTRPLCIAVTQLTSTNQTTLENDLLIQKPIEEVIASYATTAEKSGMDGVVCSAWESQLIKSHTRDSFLTVTPGIRLLGDAVGDQKRVATPAKARELKSDYIVVGRSITKAENPVDAYEKVCKEWSEGHA